MIAKMLKTTIICRSEDKEKTLSDLREFGCLHVELGRIPDSEEQLQLAQKILKISQLLTGLSEFKPREDEKIAKMQAPELFDAVAASFERIEQLKRSIDDLDKDMAKLAPWGDFAFEKIDELAASGLHIYLCAAHPSEIEKYREKGTPIIVKSNTDIAYFILVSETELELRELPRAPMPAENVRLSTLQNRKSAALLEMQEKKHFLAAAASQIPKLSHYQQCISDDHEFATNSNHMGDDKQGLCFIGGYVPAAQAEQLRASALAKGFAVSLREPAEEEEPPTKLEIPKYFRMAQTIFDFIGVSPSYREWDVSIAFLVFLTIYFAMLVGDGGYALIFLAAVFYVKLKIKPKSEAAHNAMNLIIVFSVATLVWAFLTGSFFGIHTSHLPKFMQGLDIFTGEGKDKYIQFVCFMLAGLHLSVARIWQACIQGFRKGLGQIGWMLIVWGNFFVAVNLIVWPGPIESYVFWLYGIGFSMVCIFGVNWFHVHEVFDLPFGMIGAFVDVMSYIRLFAVGVSGVYIAENFNTMAMMPLGISKGMIVLTVVVLLFGHLLNIALALMAVLVHGIRLNALEFSNHMQIKWAGQQYRPFMRRAESAGLNE